MSYALFLAALIIILAILGSKLSMEVGIPSLLLFIGIGLFFGSDGFVHIPFDNFDFTAIVCTIALIFIMFYGGFGTKWETAKPVALKAFLLSTLGVLITAVATGLFCYFVLKIPLLESLLLGAVVSSTDAASVFSILKSKKLSLKYQTSPMLELESGSNDPTAYMLTLIVLQLMDGTANYKDYLYQIPLQFVVAIGVAVALSAVTLQLHKRFNHSIEGLEVFYFVGMVLLAYSSSEILGGNGYLSIYILGIILGNRQIKGKREIVHFFDGLTNLMQLTIFFLLGLLAFPSQMPSIIGIALAIAAFLAFIARPLAMFVILKPLGSTMNQINLVSFAGIRGASAIVFAIIATVSAPNLSYDIYHIVFCVVLLSIAIQGTFLPYVAKKLDMIDDESDVMKTFTDYQDENTIQLVRMTIEPGHPWVGKSLEEISILPNMLMVLILRGEKYFFPFGQFVIFSGDVIVGVAPGLQDSLDIETKEVQITSKHEWCGQAIKDITLSRNSLIVMIERDRNVIVPNGDEILLKGDKLVMIDDFDPKSMKRTL